MTADLNEIRDLPIHDGRKGEGARPGDVEDNRERHTERALDEGVEENLPRLRSGLHLARLRLISEAA